MNNIMLDLETLGNKPGSVIVAIGAVRFGKGITGEEFYTRVDAQSCVDAGLTLDVGTVLWWMKQSDAARAELTQEGEPLEVALLQFREFAARQPLNKNLIWGNGVDFDNTLLAHAYQKLNITTPWTYWNNRCYRTLKGLHPEIKLESAGVKHNALEDARAQAVHLMAMYPEI